MAGVSPTSTRSDAVRSVVQRVASASVRVAGDLVCEMDAGLLALVGVGREDTGVDARELAKKLVHLRIFPDEEGRMDRSLLDTGGTLGIVSQFTLFGDVRKGRRPYFGSAAPPDQAEDLLEDLVSATRALGVSVVTGRFRAQMEVSLVNDGPVTLLLETQNTF
jgi:D-tyrosyl-tRNA(Tyr) deacylase